MTTWFVCRHPGAIDWIRAKNIKIDEFREHLTISEVSIGDVVIGVLPMFLAAAVCAKGARFIGMEFSQSRESRGHELGVDELRALNCRLREFVISEV